MIWSSLSLFIIANILQVQIYNCIRTYTSWFIWFILHADLYFYFSYIYTYKFPYIYTHRYISQCFSYILLLCMPRIFFYVLHMPYLMRNFPLFHLNTKRRAYTEIARTVPPSSCSPLHLPCLSSVWNTGIPSLFPYLLYKNTSKPMMCSSNRVSSSLSVASCN